MRLWVALVILLYLLCISIIVVPLFHLATGGSSDESEMMKVFYFMLVPVLAIAQGVLLLVPVGVAQERPIKRRGVVVSIVIIAIPMAILTFGFLLSLGFMILGESPVIDHLNTRPVFISLIIFWLVWSVLFLKSYKAQSPQSCSSQLTRWLLRGSILELIVAIPSHIISRHRRDCCAPEITLLGIAAGLSIALLSFGPGIFLLFAQRIKNKKGKRHLNNEELPS